MRKILVSACLCGYECTHEGGGNDTGLKIMRDWADEGRLVCVCPEVMGGLGVPREAAEIVGDRVVTAGGRDVSGEYMEGARKTLELARSEDVIFAILKENSPSCGSNAVYDGSFSGKRVPGRGVTARLLAEQGIEIYNELHIVEAYRKLDEEEFNDDIFDEIMSMRI